jgi:peptidoglycan endopeptidase LytE
MNKILKILILVFFAVILNSCESIIRYASTKSYKSLSTGKSSNSKIDYSDIEDSNDPIIVEAKRWLGTPYCWGGEDMHCTDCSGFVQSVFSKNGYRLPRTAQELFDKGKNISESSVEPTDLIFFGDNSKITHVGIYLGNHFFIHAASSKGVSIASLDEEYYKNKFVGFKRLKN